MGTQQPQSTLQVAGEVQVGNTGVTCTAANKGAFRYTSQPEYCNGAQWTAFGGGCLTGVVNDVWSGCGAPSSTTGNALYTSGSTVHLDWYSVAYCAGFVVGQASDARLKTSISNLPEEKGLAAIMKLRPVTFGWKDTAREAKEGEQIGFIAQEVEKVFPDLVQTGSGVTLIHTAKGDEKIDNPKSMKYQALVAPLVKAVQEQQTEIDALKEQVKALEKQKAKDQ
jgi:hypothetical protein